MNRDGYRAEVHHERAILTALIEQGRLSWTPFVTRTNLVNNQMARARTLREQLIVALDAKLDTAPPSMAADIHRILNELRLLELPMISCPSVDFAPLENAMAQFEALFNGQG